VDDLWAAKSEEVGLSVRAISFQDFQPMWSWSINVTDGQTDDTRWQDRAVRAMHYSASRGKNLPHRLRRDAVYIQQSRSVKLRFKVTQKNMYDERAKVSADWAEVAYACWVTNVWRRRMIACRRHVIHDIVVIVHDVTSGDGGAALVSLCSWQTDFSRRLQLSSKPSRSFSKRNSATVTHDDMC